MRVIPLKSSNLLSKVSHLSYQYCIYAKSDEYSDITDWLDHNIKHYYITVWAVSIEWTKYILQIDTKEDATIFVLFFADYFNID